MIGRLSALLLLAAVAALAGVVSATAVDRSTDSARVRACPLKGVKLPGVQYVGKPLNHEAVENFPDIEDLVKRFYGGLNVCFGVSRDGKKLRAYAFPGIFSCVDGSSSAEFVEKSPRMVAIQKSGAFSAGTSSSFFKGRILPGGKAAGTLRERAKIAAGAEERLCDTGIVRWTAVRVAR